MRASTGLKTIDGITRHVPKIVLSFEECQKIQEWLPQGGTLSIDLDRVMAEAKEKAIELNEKSGIRLST
jgi:hypothetical protein